jgi:hypothetical protein
MEPEMRALGSVGLREQLKLNEKCKMVYLRFARLKPHDVYGLGLKRDQFCGRCEPPTRIDPPSRVLQRMP